MSLCKRKPGTQVPWCLSVEQKQGPLPQNDELSLYHIAIWSGEPTLQPTTRWVFHSPEHGSPSLKLEITFLEVQFL